MLISKGPDNALLLGFFLIKKEKKKRNIVGKFSLTDREHVVYLRSSLSPSAFPCMRGIVFFFLNRSNEVIRETRKHASGIHNEKMLLEWKWQTCTFVQHGIIIFGASNEFCSNIAFKFNQETVWTLFSQSLSKYPLQCKVKKKPIVMLGGNCTQTISRIIYKIGERHFSYVSLFVM